jgi:glutathione synthase/RimK-type ligase-like ATP-grasp enzyme
MPPTLRVARELLHSAAENAATLPRGLQFPLIVRPLDSHAGHDLHKIESPAVLAATLPALPGDEFFVSNFIDYSGADGLFRKYRVILVDGVPHACHMGVSRHWMIHYLNAGMAESERKRAEEARWMANFEEDFAHRHRKALAGIAHAIGLNYLGIDCAETATGELLVFEVDPAMVVHSMDPIDLYPYKPATMYKIFTAFRAMLMHAAGMKEAATRSYA